MTETERIVIFPGFKPGDIFAEHHDLPESNIDTVDVFAFLLDVALTFNEAMSRSIENQTGAPLLLALHEWAEPHLMTLATATIESLKAAGKYDDLVRETDLLRRAAKSDPAANTPKEDPHA
jgi:hypothetical protein